MDFDSALGACFALARLSQLIRGLFVLAMRPLWTFYMHHQGVWRMVSAYSQHGNGHYRIVVLDTGMGHARFYKLHELKLYGALKATWP